MTEGAVVPDRPAAAVWRRCAPVVWELVDDEVVAYHEDSHELHRLDPTATVVWQLLDGATPLGPLAAELATAYGAPEAVVLADVAALLQRLGDASLAETVDGDAVA